MNRAAMMIIALGFCASVTVHPSAEAQVQSAIPASPPPLAAPKAFIPPTALERRLANGLETSLIPFGAAPLTYIQLTIRAGRLSEPVDRHGLAAITASYLREGTRSFDRSAINLTTARLGLIDGDIQINVGDAETVISARVLPDSASALLRLIASFVREPSFPANAPDDVKRNEAQQAAARGTRNLLRAPSS